MVDRVTAAQILASASLEPGVRAALVCQEAQVWAYGGHLPRAWAEELALRLARQRSLPESGDLARFVTLSTASSPSAGPYLLYATSLNETLTLALVFDAETPFSRARARAITLRRILSQIHPAEPVTLEVQGLFTGEEHREFSQVQEPIRQKAPLAAAPQSASILGDVPPPNPSPAGWYHEAQDGHLEPVPAVTPPLPAPVGRIPQQPEADLDDEPAAHVEDMEDLLEPASPTLASLPLTCLLTPRLPGHYLRADIARELGQAMPQLCAAFAWRLEGLVIRPDHMEWRLLLSPGISPARMLRILRQRTSQRLFTHFPHLRRENPSGDFWAPGYLVVGGTRSLAEDTRREFIARTRRRQFVPEFMP